MVKPSFEIEYKETKKGTILKNKDFEISAFPLKHEVTCFAYVFKEKNKIGEFNRKKAEKLGIPVGPLYSKLVSGKTIKINGKTFTQKDVMDYSKSKEGRKIVFVSDTRPIKEIIQHSKNADILIHEATFLEKQKDKAIETLHTTALEAATTAKKAKAKKLILFHFSARNSDPEEILKEAKKEFSETKIAKELETITI